LKIKSRLVEGMGGTISNEKSADAVRNARTCAKRDFRNLMIADLSRLSGTSAADQSRQEATRALQLQLTKNLLELARQFVGCTDKANDFFDQSRLYNRKRAEDVPELAVT
jgi:hypothetical protein